MAFYTVLGFLQPLVLSAGLADVFGPIFVVEDHVPRPLPAISLKVVGFEVVVVVDVVSVEPIATVAPEKKRDGVETYFNPLEGHRWLRLTRQNAENSGDEIRNGKRHGSRYQVERATPFSEFVSHPAGVQ